jgi:hypothetical protein
VDELLEHNFSESGSDEDSEIISIEILFSFTITEARQRFESWPGPVNKTRP